MSSRLKVYALIVVGLGVPACAGSDGESRGPASHSTADAGTDSDQARDGAGVDPWVEAGGDSAGDAANDAVGDVEPATDGPAPDGPVDSGGSSAKTPIRPTLQARAGYNPDGWGPGISAPFGTSTAYAGYHHGQDYFWLSAASAAKLGISTAESKVVYPVIDGVAHRTESTELGHGFWQQLDANTRAYYWHLSQFIAADDTQLTVTAPLGVMGHTGTAAGSADHLHFEIRLAPFEATNRVDPEPYFAALSDDQKMRYRQIAAFLNTHAANLNLPTTTTEQDGIPGPNYWRLVQGLGKAWGFYSGAVDGVPGPLTYDAETYIWENYVKP